LGEPADRHGAFPRLTDEQRARLLAIGALRAVASGEVLYQEGDAGYDFFVIESGAVAIVAGYGMEDRVIAVHGAHRFLGELNLLTRGGVLLTAVVRDPGVVIQVPAARLRGLLGGDEDLAQLILRAYLARRAILVELGAGVRVVGWTATENAVRVREFLTRARVPHHWVDLQDDEVATLASALSAHADELPLVICGQTVLRNPSNTELAAALGLGSGAPPPALCDLVIIGGGPAGLAAAVYGASEGLDTVLLDAVALGGQAGMSSRIENFLGLRT
jgi:thioredoxin reductase (NADPH)